MELNPGYLLKSFLFFTITYYLFLKDVEPSKSEAINDDYKLWPQFKYHVRISIIGGISLVAHGVGDRGHGQLQHAGHLEAVGLGHGLGRLG